MKKYILGFIFIGYSAFVNAQCVMCRAVAESSSTIEQGSNIGEGLNSGILYLMAIPYVLLGTLTWVFFRQKIKSFLGWNK